MNRMALSGAMALAASLALASCNKPSSTAAPSANVLGGPAGGGGTSTAPGPAATGMPAPAVPIATGAAIRPQGATAESPDPETVALIYFSLAGQAPPYDDWTHQDFQFVSDEFERAKKSDAALAVYKSKFAFAGTVGHIVLPMQSQLSEYDDKYSEFYVDAFSPSSSWTFPYKGQTYKIEFTNGDQAQHWKLAAADAGRVIERNSGNHSVTVAATLDITGDQPASDGGSVMAAVKSYTVESAGRREPLGTVTVTPPGAR